MGNEKQPDNTATALEPFGEMAQSRSSRQSYVDSSLLNRPQYTLDVLISVPVHLRGPGLRVRVGLPHARSHVRPHTFFLPAMLNGLGPAGFLEHMRLFHPKELDGIIGQRHPHLQFNGLTLDRQLAALEDCARQNHGDVAGPEGNAAGTGEVGPMDWPSYNKSQRVSATTWVIGQSGPLDCFLSDMLTAPTFHYLELELARTALRFTQRSFHRKVQNVVDGIGGVRDVFLNREWPLTTNLTGEVDMEFFPALERSCQPELLEHLPDHVKTYRTNSMCFKLASRQGCYFQEFVADPHLLPPYDLLATVYKPETVPAVLSQCPKLRDPYS